MALTVAGSQFLVNSTTLDNQFAPVVASDDAGDSVAVWVSNGTDGSGTGIYARRFSPTGVAQGGEFRVNTITAGMQTQPAVAMTPDGRFVVAWTSENVSGGADRDIVARRYAADGTARDAAEFTVNTYVASTQEAPDVAVDSAGDFIVVWDSLGEDGSDYGVFDRSFNDAGVAQTGEVQINQTTADLQADPTIDMNARGDYVIAWDSGSPNASAAYDIYARFYLASSATLGPETLVNSESGQTTDYQIFPSAGIDANGNSVIAWDSYGTDGSDYGVYAKRFSGSGAALGAIFRVNTTTAGAQSDADVDMSASGEFTIVWDSAGQDGSGLGVFAQSYSTAGATVGAERQVNTTTANDQSRPSIALNRDGDALIVWQDGSTAINGNGADGSGYGVYAQRFGHPPVVVSAAFNYVTQALVFSFSENVAASLSNADFTIADSTHGGTVGLPTSLAYDASTNTATLSISGTLPNANFTATLLGSGVSDAGGTALDGDGDGTPGGDATLSFFALAGDLNHNRTVDISDLSVLASNFGMSSRTFAQGDFNRDGTVDISDLTILATNFGISLPAPSTASASAAAPAETTTAKRRAADRIAAQVLG